MMFFFTIQQKQFESVSVRVDRVGTEVFGCRKIYRQVLKTYMGHSLFRYTAYYLRLTKDMFPDIREKMEAYYAMHAERVPGNGGAEQ